MKPQNQDQFESSVKTALAFIAVLAIFSVAGCASTGYDKGDAAATSLREAAAEVQGQGRALEVTMGTLNELVTKPEPDLKPQFKRFGKSLDDLAASARRNERAQVRITQKSAAYFEAWDKQLATMNYEAVRSRSAARKAEVTNSLDSVNKRYRETQDAMGPLMNYLSDVRKALDSDLTPNGVQAAKPIVEKARENAGKVQLALGHLSTELTDCSSRMSSAIYQNASSAPTGTVTKEQPAQPKSLPR